MVKAEERKAKVKLHESQDKMLDRFCPVINAFCRRDCACYYKGLVETKMSNGTEKYITRNAYCTHVLINGTIYTENN